MAPDLAAIACAARIDRAFVQFARGHLLVVCYHGVTDNPLPEGCPSWHHVDVAEFERQVRYITRHFTVLPIDDALSAIDAGTSDRIAAITFDDGYRNNRTVALPVLRALGVPATVYLATGLVERGGLLWTVRLEAAIRQTDRRSIDLSGVGLGERHLGDDTARAGAAAEAIGELKKRSPATRDAALDHLLERLGTPDPNVFEPFRMLDWHDVAAMDAEGLVTFGAHTVNHEILSRLDDARLRAEIGGSIASVAEHVSRPSSTFAYPNGTRSDFDDRSIRELREAAVSAALTTIEGLNDRASDRFTLRRIVVGRGMGFDRFRLSASGFTAMARRFRPG